MGSDCEDHCCWGWRVDVDRKTYKLYRNSSDPVLKPRLAQALKRNHHDATDNNYAVLENHGGVCPMLTVEKLCSIQLRLGEKALCHTCLVYPRSGALVAGRHQIVGTVSCPELARQALLRPEGIQLEEVELPLTGTVARLKFARSINPDQPEQPSDQFFQPLRTFSLRLLQHRAWPLWRRIAGLALFCRLVDQRVEQGKVDTLPGLIDTFNTLLDDGGLAAQVDQIQIDMTPLQRQLLDALGVERIYAGLQHRDAFVDLLREAWIGLGVLTAEAQPNPQAAEPDFLLNRFRAAARDHYWPFFAEREYLLENYLVNLALQRVFPCRPHGSLFKNLLTLVLPYALLRYFLIGSAAYHQGLNEAVFIRAVYAFSRRIEHHSSFLNHIRELLERNGYDTPAGLVALVKDV
ncbi:MAG: flagellin lysine-N-methylase [Candidatus Competibacteraceae bacterium]|nr:flagellin lysine-N-methylase [Candidatus Competibacteraceae bacterium]